MSTAEKLRQLLNDFENPEWDRQMAWIARTFNSGIEFKFSLGYNQASVNNKTLVINDFHRYYSCLNLVESFLPVLSTESQEQSHRPVNSKVKNSFNYQFPWLLADSHYHIEWRRQGKVFASCTGDVFSLKEMRFSPEFVEALTAGELTLFLRSYLPVDEGEESLKRLGFEEPQMHGLRYQSLFREILAKDTFSSWRETPRMKPWLDLIASPNFMIEHKNLLIYRLICEGIESRFKIPNFSLKSQAQLWERVEAQSQKYRIHTRFLNNPQAYFNVTYLNHVGTRPAFFLLYPKGFVSIQERVDEPKALG